MWCWEAYERAPSVLFFEKAGVWGSKKESGSGEALMLHIFRRRKTVWELRQAPQTWGHWSICPSSVYSDRLVFEDLRQRASLTSSKYHAGWQDTAGSRSVSCHISEILEYSVLARLILSISLYPKQMARLGQAEEGTSRVGMSHSNQLHSIRWLETVWGEGVNLQLQTLNIAPHCGKSEREP